MELRLVVGWQEPLGPEYNVHPVLRVWMGNAPFSGSRGGQRSMRIPAIIRLSRTFFQDRKDEP